MGRSRLADGPLLHIAAIAALVALLVTCHTDTTMGSCDAVSLAITGQPNTLAAGTTLPPIRIEARDASAHLVACFGGHVTLSLAPNARGAVVTGGTTVSAVGGVAIFSDVRIDQAGTGYALSAAAAGLTAGTSATFSVIPAAPSHLVFAVPPVVAAVGVPMAPSVVVAVQDSFGNLATGFSGSVTMMIGTNPVGDTLDGTTTVVAAAGVATFGNLELDAIATGYTLVATSAGLAADTSGTFNVVPVPSMRLVFTVQPSSVSAGVAIAPAVAVTVQDTLGATLTGFADTVRIGIGTNPVGGALTGTTAVAAVAGIATFADLAIDKAGSGYTLVATSDSVLPATSATFDVTGGGTGSLPRFGHEVIVLEENHNFDQADSAAMPYLHSLIAKGGLATQYYANTHPSIGNYFWLTTGQLITNNDSYSLTVSSDNIVRQLLAAGKTWKSYAEDLPSVGFTGQTSGKYARKHNPLSFFSDVVNDSAQIKRLVPFTQFATDLAGDTLPNYAFVVPNLNDDAHDGTLQAADAWLQTNIAPLLTSPSFQVDGLLIIVFDESDTDNTNGGGRVVWAVISPKAKAGFTSSTLYQHQNTLRLMAEGLGLTSFPGAAATTSNMAEFFTP